MNDEILDTVLN